MPKAHHLVIRFSRIEPCCILQGKLHECMRRRARAPRPHAKASREPPKPRGRIQLVRYLGGGV